MLKSDLSSGGAECMADINNFSEVLALANRTFEEAAIPAATTPRLVGRFYIAPFKIGEFTPIVFGGIVVSEAADGVRTAHPRVVELIAIYKRAATDLVLALRSYFQISDAELAEAEGRNAHLPPLPI